MMWIVVFFIALFLLAYISLQGYKVYLKNSTKIKVPNGISSLEEILLGGLKQWIFIRGEDQSNPVLIFLHGGPGAPLAGMASSRIYDTELIKHFIIVHWDQRGAGKSFNRNIPIETMTYDRLVEDCNELIDLLRIRFNTKKVFVVGHSSGSIIGIKTAYKYPQKIHAYVGVGQIINQYESQNISQNYVVEQAKKSGNVKVKKTVQEIGLPPHDTPEKSDQINRYVFKYGGVIHNDSNKQLGGLLLRFLTSPEYSLSEGFNCITNKGYKFSTSIMWEEIRDINLAKEIQSIEIPIYLFEGEYDMATPTIIVKNFYDNMGFTKGKKLIIFENSAHLPMIEEKDKYEDLLINVVLKQNRPK